MRFLKMEKRRLVARANSIGSACPTGMHAPGEGAPSKDWHVRAGHGAVDV